MLTQEEKLRRFEKAVNDEIDAEIINIQKSAEDTKDEIIEKANDESLYDAYDTIKAEIKNISNKYAKLVSKAELDGKKEILLHREEIASKIMDNVIASINKFRETDDYINFLAKALKEEIDTEDISDITVYLTADDMKYTAKLDKLFGKKLKYEAKDSIRLGGVSVFFESRNIIKDRTLDSALEDEKNRFNKSDCLRLS